jgi:hypothetical protein
MALKLGQAPRMKLFSALTALLLPVLAACAEPGEQEVRAEIKAKAGVALRERDFAALNAMAEEYRTSDQRTPSGGAYLTYFYIGLEDYAHQRAPLLAEGVNNAEWTGAVGMIQEWIAKAPSPAAYIALAKLHLNWAWEFRGNDFAGNVNPLGWDPFFAKLRDARHALETSKAGASLDPEWYATSISLSRAEELDGTKRAMLFREAMTRFPYYQPIHFYIADAIHPKWGGSWLTLDRFAREESVNATKEKDGFAMYARIYVAVQRGCNCLVVKDTNADWATLKLGFNDVISRHPSQWNIGYYAYFACAARDIDESRAIFGKLGEYNAEIWNDQREDYDNCRTWALNGR